MKLLTVGTYIITFHCYSRYKSESVSNTVQTREASELTCEGFRDCRSGRCWLFATTNCARLAFAKKHNVTEFQFSQSYLFFWDKLEKGECLYFVTSKRDTVPETGFPTMSLANFYLENMIDLVEEDLDSRIVQYLNQSPENGEFDTSEQDCSNTEIVHVPFQTEDNGTWLSICWTSTV